MTSQMLDLPALVEIPYVYSSDNSWFQSKQVAGCQKTGPIMFGDKGLQVVCLPCHSFECDECGPIRCGEILDAMDGYFHAGESVWLHRVTPSSASSPAEQKCEVQARSRTITNAINERGGDHLCIDTLSDGLSERHIFSNVDHSTKRRNRGNPPRLCDDLSPADAVSYLGRLLINGIARRRSSMGWKLTDGEYAQRGTSDRMKVGFGNEPRRHQIEETARSIYDAEGGTDWPRYRHRPMDYEIARAAALFRRANAQLTQKPANLGSSYNG